MAVCWPFALLIQKLVRFWGWRWFLRTPITCICSSPDCIVSIHQMAAHNAFTNFWTPWVLLGFLVWCCIWADVDIAFISSWGYVTRLLMLVCRFMPVYLDVCSQSGCCVCGGDFSRVNCSGGKTMMFYCSHVDAGLVIFIRNQLRCVVLLRSPWRSFGSLSFIHHLLLPRSRHFLCFCLPFIQ